MKIVRTMAMVAALGSLALLTGCKDKSANAGGSTPPPTGNSAATGSATPAPAKPQAAAGGPQAVLNQWVEAIQLEDFQTAAELSDEASPGRADLMNMTGIWENMLDKVDKQMQGAEMALQLTRGTLLGPWKDAVGTVTQTEGNFAQATVTRGGGAEPLSLSLNKQADGKWLVVAPTDLFGGGTVPPK